MKNLYALAIVVYFLLVNVISAAGQSEITQAYPVSSIADSLKVNSNAVVRDEILEYTYLSPLSNVLLYRKVVTVLNKNGDACAAFLQSYNKFSKIIYFRGEILDGNGKLVRKIKPSEISDYSGSAGYALFDDVRYKSYEPLVSIYPYTVAFEYEMQLSGSLSFPRWMAFEDYNVSIEKTQLKVTVPEDYRLRYKEFNMDNQVDITSDGKNKSYLWKVENIMAIDREPFAEEMIRYVKAVYTAPSDFSFGGYSGKMDTWQDFARWIQQLNNERDILPEDRIQQIRELVKDLPDDREKVRKLYTYLQGKTRYFNIALGIGGLQPVEAKTVDEVGYGDCKGLSNYMKALLKAAGITSYYTLVKSGGSFPQIIADFPCNQFDHVILCVPIRGDTVWLECTSQIIPFGFLGDFTSDRYALVINEQGGQLVKIPEYTLDENAQVTKAKVVITPDGNGSAEVVRCFGGLQFDDILQPLHSSAEDQKEWLYKYISLPDYQISKFEFKPEPSGKPESVLRLSLQLSHYGSSSGKRMFLPVNLTNRSTYVPPKVKQRLHDIVMQKPYIDADSMEYSLPEGFEIEFIPEPTNIISPFGEYSSSCARKDNTIVYSRQVRRYKGTYPNNMYGELSKFYRDINNADKEQIILIKKEILP
jgi:hypothetical protein